MIYKTVEFGENTYTKKQRNNAKIIKNLKTQDVTQLARKSWKPLIYYEYVC